MGIINQVGQAFSDAASWFRTRFFGKNPHATAEDAAVIEQIKASMANQAATLPTTDQSSDTQQSPPPNPPDIATLLDNRYHHVRQGRHGVGPHRNHSGPIG